MFLVDQAATHNSIGNFQLINNLNPELALTISSDVTKHVQVSSYFKKVRKLLKVTDLVKFSNFNEIFRKFPESPEVTWLFDRFKKATGKFNYVIQANRTHDTTLLQNFVLLKNMPLRVLDLHKH